MIDLTDDIPAYVINLARDTKRWENISTNLEYIGVPFKRVAAIDARRYINLVRALVKNDFRYPAAKRGLTDGEICCYLSHLAALKCFLRGKQEAAIIFEDDAVFANSFSSFYRSDLKTFLQISDIVKFEGIHYAHTSRGGLVMRRGKTTKLLIRPRPTLGAAAYAVTRAGARALIKVLSDIDRPYDHKLAYYDRHWINYAETEPFWVHQANNDSNLEADREIRDEGNPMPDRVDNARLKLSSSIRAIVRSIYVGKFLLSWLLSIPTRVR